MKFDTILIGGGLAGLTCGIQLVGQGKKCLIVSSGQSALHFSSGSFDLLNQVNGEAISNPIEAIDRLSILNPSHPYAKIGKANVVSYARQAKALLERTGVETVGEENKNHFRITPLGILKPTWLSVPDYAVSPDDKALPWKKVSIFNIAGFLDFHPTFICEQFEKMGTQSDILTIDTPELDILRRNPSELRATNISQLFENETAFRNLAGIMRKGRNHSEAIIIPACLGLNGNSISKLSAMIDCPVYMIPTFPPSLAGIRSQRRMMKYFQKSGGYYMLGDVVNNIQIAPDGSFQVTTGNHGDVRFCSSNLVLATGSFFSRGIVALRNKIVEPVMGLDTYSSDDRNEWYAENFFDDQKYQYYGVKTNDTFQVMKEGKVIENFYAAGAILSGFNPLKEGCGSGVSLLTALHIAGQILKK
ncbi:MAG: glycerol-3-phosphate dehydrogenase subunit GlpB [Tannerellaceae bacterium]|jgi:glycerol-3-phosphate dehydrogenase subunit B|nr:glycerol-3-phosphate dehydrogenase subunit GlpB [Tannerellaceae bacterium]